MGDDTTLDADLLSVVLLLLAVADDVLKEELAVVDVVEADGVVVVADIVNNWNDIKYPVSWAVIHSESWNDNMRHQPCQRCKYTTSVDIKKTRYKKLVTHVEPHASAVSLLKSK